MFLRLHIGTCKTGTTSIQKFLSDNKKELSKQGILYPDSMRAQDNIYHNFFYLYGCDPNELSRELVWYENVNSDRPSKLLSIELDKLNKELKSSNAIKCIISNEQLSSNLQTKQQIEKIKEITDNLFDDVEIILYIRRPIEYFISNVSTQILGGYISPKGKPLSNKTIIEVWSKTYGIEKIKVRIFDKSEFFQNDFIKDFCTLTDIEINDNFVYPGLQNDSLNLIQLKYLNYFNEKIPKLKKNDKGNYRKNPLRRNLISFIRNNFPSKSKYLPSEVEFKEYEEYFDNDNDWIRKKFFPNKKKLFGDYDKGFRIIENELTNISLEEKMLLEALNKIWINRSRLLIEKEKKNDMN